MATTSRVARRRSERRLGGLIVLGLAVAMGGGAGWYFLTTVGRVGQPVVTTAVEFLWVWLPIGGLFAGGYWLTTDEFEREEAIGVAGWSVAGVVALTALLVLILLHQQAQGATITDPFLVFLAMASEGAALGLLLGVYTVRLNRRATELERSQDRLGTVNSLLRHDILNKVNVIQGYAFRGREGTPADANEMLANIGVQAEAIADLIDRARIVSRAVEEDQSLEPVDMTRVLREAVASVHEMYPEAEIETAIPDGPARVDADELAGAVFENLLTNAIEHNDATPPRVWVDLEREAESVVVRVADNGPGVPEPAREGLFDRADDSSNHGLGLYIVDTLVSNYGGTVRLEDGERSGATFVVTLPAASSARPVARR